MSGNDNDGSVSIYGNDVEIVTSEAASSSSATASNKVRSTQQQSNELKEKILALL